MKKTLVIMIVVACASVASAEKMWAISDDNLSGENALIFSFETSTGAFIDTPVLVPGINHTHGLAVVGDTAYIACRVNYDATTNPNDYTILTYDLPSHTITHSSPIRQGLDQRIRGLTMSLDGSTLYGMIPATNMLAVVNPVTGDRTEIAGPTVYSDDYTWSSLPGIDIRTDRMWTQTYHYRYEYWDGPVYSGPSTHKNRFFDDQTSATAFGLYDGAGYIWQNKCVSYIVRWGDPEVMTGTNQQVGMYDLSMVNSYVFGGYGLYGMSPVFVPEPATMGLLAMGGLGLLLRKRSR